jgi:hypothetical protein
VRWGVLQSVAEKVLAHRQVRLLREQDQAGAFELPVPPQVRFPGVDDRFAICGPAALTISRDANTGAGEDLTDLAAAVQLRLRVRLGCKL